jgi:hypothetical protein
LPYPPPEKKLLLYIMARSESIYVHRKLSLTWGTVYLIGWRFAKSNFIRYVGAVILFSNSTTDGTLSLEMDGIAGTIEFGANFMSQYYFEITDVENKVTVHLSGNGKEFSSLGMGTYYSIWNAWLDFTGYD